jgi:tetratricopeptide (TPR) repeat protein
MLAGVVIAVAVCWIGTTIWGRWMSPARGDAGITDGLGRLTPLDAAMELLGSGDTEAAEELLEAVAEEAGDRHGHHSPQHAAACFDLATLRAAAGDATGAVKAMREACRVEVTDGQSRQDRLTYQMNLAELLRAAGELDRAEQVLRSSLDEREQLYGSDHPGYARGLEALADILLARGRAEEALPLVEEAAASYRQHDHRRLAASLALRAHALKSARGSETSVFDDLDELSGGVLLDLVSECAKRGESGDPVLTLKVLQDLRSTVEGHYGAQDPRLLVIVTHIANTARFAGDHEEQIEAIRWVVQRWQQEGDEYEVVHALQGLGLAHSEAGDPGAAEAAYREAIERVERLDDPRLTSVVLRNAGLFLAEVDRRPEAAELLASAVKSGRQSGDDETLARALAAQGVFLQHGGALDEARAPLEEAFALLPASHPDALYVSSHLEALVAGGPCSCDLNRAMAEAIREAVLAELPGGLVEDVRVELVEGGAPQVQVETTRQPTEEEAALVNRVVNHAINQVLRGAR